MIKVDNDLSSSDAYRESYSTKSKSDSLIHKEASKLANNRKVTVRLEELKKERSKRLNYDAGKVLLTLSDMLNADILDIYDIDIGTFKPLANLPKVSLRWKGIAEFTLTLVS